MSQQAQLLTTSTGLPRLPTEDDLPYEDGMPMETLRHRLQMELLIHSLDPWAAARGDVFVSGNQFVYFSALQLRGQDFRGSDVFVVCDVSRRERKSWVVWEEGKAPDVVIELISASTAKSDKGEKKQLYQNQLRVANYFWLDPFDIDDRSGFTLQNSRYAPIPRDANGCLPVPSLGLKLCLWQGEYLGVDTTWLRWADAQGLLLLPEEAERQRTAVERQRAEVEWQRAETERQRADAAEQELTQLRSELKRSRSAG